MSRPSPADPDRPAEGLFPGVDPVAPQPGGTPAGPAADPGPPDDRRGDAPGEHPADVPGEYRGGAPGEHPAGVWAGTAPPGPGGWRPEAAWPGQPVTQPDPPRKPRHTLGVGAGAVAVLTVLGAPLGLLWAFLSPGVPVVQTADGAVLTEPQPEGFIAADGWFSLLGLGFGLLAAIAVWSLLRRHRGPFGLLVAVVGSLTAAVLAWRVGRLVGLAEYETLRDSAPVGQTFDRPADLRAGGFDWLFGVVPVLQGDVLLAAFAAAVTYTLLAGWSRWPSLRPETEPILDVPGPALADPTAFPGPAAPAPPSGPHPAAPVSWGSVPPPTPPAAPEPPAPDAAEPPRG